MVTIMIINNDNVIMVIILPFDINNNNMIFFVVCVQCGDINVVMLCTVDGVGDLAVSINVTPSLSHQLSGVSFITHNSHTNTQAIQKLCEYCLKC